VNKANNPGCQGNRNNLRKKGKPKSETNASEKEPKVLLINIARNSFTMREGVIGRVINEFHADATRNFLLRKEFSER
jgi:hypothetical protein